MTTPPQSQPRCGTASQISNTTREDILDNIDGHIHGPASKEEPGMISVFETATPTSITNGHTTTTSDTGVFDTIVLSTPETFSKWISTRRSRCSTAALWAVEASDRSVKFSMTTPSTLVLSKGPSSTASTNTCASGHVVQVVGLFVCTIHHDDDKDIVVNYKDSLIRLCHQAQKVFEDQPTRLFLHGVLLLGNSLLEVWTFDRSGIYCSRTVDLSSSKEETNLHLGSILDSFEHMNDQDLGSGDLMGHDEAGRFIRLDPKVMATASIPSEVLYLHDEALVTSDEIVGAGTACYRARVPESDRFKYVVKFKWRSVGERPEREMLDLARQRSAKGVVCLQYYTEIYSTTQLPGRPHHQPCRKFRVKESLQDSTIARAQVKSGILDCTVVTHTPFQERILTVTVTTPAGRPLHTFSSRLELLYVMRDAIQAHRSLFQTAKILHKDVSAGNIIIVEADADTQAEAKNQRRSHGILIDLDSAADISLGRGEAGHIIGTRPFMAIGVLMSRIHTHRHDLESFLYVLLWTIITGHSPGNPPKTSKLRRWNKGTFRESATLKTSDMKEETNFREILDEFPRDFESLKSLVETLRQVLFFPVTNKNGGGELYTATDGSLQGVNALYDGVIGAFDTAVLEEEEEESKLDKGIAVF